jgi:hypothetical protein
VQLEPQGSSRKNLDLFVNLLNSMTLNNSWTNYSRATNLYWFVY